MSDLTRRPDETSPEPFSMLSRRPERVSENVRAPVVVDDARMNSTGSTTPGVGSWGGNQYTPSVTESRKVAAATKSTERGIACDTEGGWASAWALRPASKGPAEAGP
jgi:hypothetical protein